MKICFFGGYDPLYPRNAVLREGLRRNGAEVVECRAPGREKFWLRYPRLFLRGLAAARRADVVFVPEFRQKDVPLARLISAWTGRLLVHDPLASRYETKILDWRRNPPSSVEAWWNLAIDRWAFGMPGLVLADTATHAEYFRSRFGLEPLRTAVVPVGYDDRLFSPLGAEKRERTGEFTVLFVGSFLPLHGVDSIVRAAAIVGRKDRSVVFRLVGDGQTRPAAAALAKDLSADNIRFDGWSRLEDLPGRIGRADVCLGIFGRTEKTARVVPHKIFQALGMGRPVVTARTPAAEEFFRHREHLFFCDPPGPVSLAEAVLELKADSGLRAAIGGNGLDLVRSRYATQPLGRRLLDVLERRFRPPKGGRR
ncbi:MAG: glycosyltransferase [Candidatus Aminicenantes bacterium]|nr:glycosyltransferase [Candidatus Aminicenantes bacterium]